MHDLSFEVVGLKIFLITGSPDIWRLKKFLVKSEYVLGLFILEDFSCWSPVLGSDDA